MKTLITRQITIDAKGGEEEEEEGQRNRRMKRDGEGEEAK